MLILGSDLDEMVAVFLQAEMWALFALSLNLGFDINVDFSLFLFCEPNLSRGHLLLWIARVQF